jgi:hypothetical protein
MIAIGIPFASRAVDLNPQEDFLTGAGHREPPPPPGPPVVVTPRLREQDLIDLAEGRVRAIHLRQYYPADYALMLSQRLTQHPLFGHYRNAPDIGRVGMAYFETVGKPELRRHYYEKAPEWIQLLRDAAAPYESPMDQLRLHLQEHWRWGATLETADGRPMFVGLARVFENGGAALPHQDVLRRDAGPDCARAGTLLTQFAANIYLRLPAEGGELDLWSARLSDEEFEAIRLPGSYGADRARLPEPDAVLSPTVGDAILFDATRLHAVRPACGGSRVTLSCFIGYRGLGQPLTYWS